MGTKIAAYVGIVTVCLVVLGMILDMGHVSSSPEIFWLCMALVLTGVFIGQFARIFADKLFFEDGDARFSRDPD